MVQGLLVSEEKPLLEAGGATPISVLGAKPGRCPARPSSRGDGGEGPCRTPPPQVFLAQSPCPVSGVSEALVLWEAGGFWEVMHLCQPPLHLLLSGQPVSGRSGFTVQHSFVDNFLNVSKAPFPVTFLN